MTTAIPRADLVALCHELTWADMHGGTWFTPGRQPQIVADYLAKLTYVHKPAARFRVLRAWVAREAMLDVMK